MMSQPVRICAAADLVDGGSGIRFPLREGLREMTGFVVRHQGRVFGYLNRCAHVPIELDWTPGVFFASDGNHLMCATHGAMYDPATGRCVGGPCRGGRLVPIVVSEQDEQVVWHPDSSFQPPPDNSNIA